MDKTALNLVGDAPLTQRQVFFYPIKDESDAEISKAKKEIYECAAYMGFTANHTPFKVEKSIDPQTMETSLRLEATFTA